MYIFHYFNQAHIINLFLNFILGSVILSIPKISKVNKYKFGTFIGYFIVLLKIFETIYRLKYEHFSWAESAPLHFCNFTIIVCGIYLISKNHILFCLSYFFSFGALSALILPGVNTYYHPLFFALFMITHSMIIISVLYGFIWFKERPDFNGFIVSEVTVLILFITAHFYNKKFGTNFMFLKTYIAPFFDFIKPFSLYIAIMIPSFLLVIFLLYIPFRKNKRG